MTVKPQAKQEKAKKKKGMHKGRTGAGVEETVISSLERKKGEGAVTPGRVQEVLCQGACRPWCCGAGSCLRPKGPSG